MLINKADSVYDHIEKIAATSSKLEKDALVKQGMSVPMFAKVVRAAYTPLVTYGIEAVPVRQDGIAPGGNTLDEDTWWTVLADLRERKLTGDAAREKVQQAVNFLTPASAELFRRILKKDLRAGFTDGTVNRVAPGTFPEFPYMRCSLFSKVDTSKWAWADGVISQEKADGMFANVDHLDDGTVRVSSRQGSAIEKLHGLAQEVRRTLKPGTQTHGELLVYVYEGEGPLGESWRLLPREDGNGVLNSVISGGEVPDRHRVVFFAWDQVPTSAVTAKGKYTVPYKERLIGLLKQIKTAGSPLVRNVDTRIVKSKAEALAHYRELLKLGKEGTIVSNPAGVWKDGTSKDKLKLKLEVVVDLKVVGFNEGTGKYAGQLGSLQLASECGKLRVDASGRGDKMRAEVWANRDNWLDGIVAVKANAIMSPDKEGDPHSLFLPIFVERRLDKSEADTLERVREQFEAAVA